MTLGFILRGVASDHGGVSPFLVADDGSVQVYIRPVPGIQPILFSSVSQAQVSAGRNSSGTEVLPVDLTVDVSGGMVSVTTTGVAIPGVPKVAAVIL